MPFLNCPRKRSPLLLSSAMLSGLFVAMPALAQVPVDAPPAKKVGDPKAWAALNRTIARYRSLKTLREVIDLSFVGEPLPGLQSFSSIVAIDRAGGRAKVTKVRVGDTWTAVSDGVTLTVTRTSEPIRYVKRSVAESVFSQNGKSVSYVFIEIGVTGPGLGFLFGEWDHDTMVRDGMTSLSLGKPQVIDGVLVETLNATFTFSKTTSAKITLLCFQGGGLLRRVVWDITTQENGAAKRLVVIEDHTKTVVDRPLPDLVFTFTPPWYAVAVTKFD